MNALNSGVLLPDVIDGTSSVADCVALLSACPVMFFAVLQEGRWPPGPA
ncbi:hypothetical protein AB0M05_43975 [Streptomyces violaceusniger]